MITNAFYFTFLFSRYLNFCLVFWSCRKTTRQERKCSKLMKSRPGYQTIEIHILTNISRSRSNQTMEFGQLIADNMGHIFLEKSCT